MKFFKRIGQSLDLQLRPTEQEELDLLDKKIRELPLNEPGYQVEYLIKVLRKQRNSIPDTYTLIKEAQEALDDAIANSEDQSKWLHALRIAREADQMILPLIENKLSNILTPSIGPKSLFTLGTYANTVLLSVIGLPLYLHLYSHTAAISNEIKCYFLMLILPVCIGNILEYYRTPISSLLTSSKTEQVLEAAKKANVKLESLSLVPVITNAEILEKIGFSLSEVPEHLCCGIGLHIMDNPIYSRFSPQRYDKNSMLIWLEERKIDPITNQDLYRKDLFPDENLKKECAEFVAQAVEEFEARKKIINTEILQPLIEQSIFRVLLDEFKDSANPEETKCIQNV